MSRRVLALVFTVLAIGTFVIARALSATRATPPDVYVVLLALLTIASGRFAIKMPGRPATVSVSEFFVFTSVLLFGPAAATLTVAVDGLVVSFMQHDRRLYRALFNVAEPAISVWVAAHVFFALAGMSPLALRHASTSTLIVPTIGMTIAYFLLNSVLTAVAVAWENGGTVYALWRQHARYLAINYYAAASLATLAVPNASGFNFGVIGLIAPLLILSYVSYKEASSRVADAHRHVREVEHLYRATIETLAIAVDAKDQVTYGHIQRVQRHALALAKALGVTDEIELKALEAASILHDVGKLAVPDYVLNKPGTLSRAEYAMMKLHVSKGAMILAAAEFPFPVVPIARHHHEQWDGRGYPDCLAGRDIPYGARILSVVDCFDALTSDRPYRRKLSDAQAIEILKERSGTAYDPSVVDTFIQLVPALRRDDDAVEHSRTLDGVISHGVPVGEPLVESIVDGTARPPLRSIAPAVMAKFERLLATAEVCLFALAPGGDALIAEYATPMLHDVAKALHLRIGEGLSGWVAANRYPIVNSEADLDLGEATFRLGLRSCTSIPVFAHGSLVGVLTVYLPAPGTFSPRDVRLVGEMAQEIGVAFTRWEGETQKATNDTLAARRAIVAVQ